MKLQPLGDQAVLVDFGSTMTNKIHQQIQMVTAFLDDHPPKWMIEYIPAYTTVTVFYDLFIVSRLVKRNESPFEYVCHDFKNILANLSFQNQGDASVVEIPVCYGGEQGPDIEFVAHQNQLTVEEVIDIHSSREYIVYMIGFAPGFPYLGGMSERIAAPRRETPRLKIPERSVGIAGIQTGIYPIETPGGWQLIGRTPFRLFDPEAEHPSLLKAGDKIRFKPISDEEYAKWEQKDDYNS